MAKNTARFLRTAAILGLCVTVAACGLPRSGPNKKEIFAGSVQQGGTALIVDVNDHVVRAASFDPPLGFPSAFIGNGQVGSDVIRAGDTLSLSIWENVDSGLLSAQGLSATTLSGVQVDGDGFIFVPYAGRIRAAGNSPEALRRVITARLDPQTPDPQVTVTREAGDGATVTLLGEGGAQGVFPIERPTRTLSAMLARAGGVSIPTETAQVKLTRGNRTGRIWLEDLYDSPRSDIALRPGDVILVEGDDRSFIAMGATGSQSVVEFTKRDLTALEALAQVGGLSTNAADPTGVFIMRTETATVANRVLGRNNLVGPQRVAYVVNLTKPNGLFLAKSFRIRDKDLIYVTEAPYVQWQKTIGAITGAATSVNSLGNAVGQ